MLVISDEPEQLGNSGSARECRRKTEVARLLGFQIITIPPEFERSGSAEAALWSLPTFSRPRRAVWVGFLPSVERY